MLGPLIQNRRVAARDRPFGGDQHLKAVAVDLIAVVQSIKVPEHTDFDFTLFEVGDHRVNHRETALLGDLRKELIGRVQILFVAAHGDCCSEHRVIGLRSRPHGAHGHTVGAGQKIIPALRGIFDEFLIDDEGHGTGVAETPVTVLILGPGGNLIPGRGLVGHRDTLFAGELTEFKTDVTDVRRGVFTFGHDFGDLLGRTHIRVLGLDAEFLQILPGTDPVGPGVGHTDGIYLTFFLRGL